MFYCMFYFTCDRSLSQVVICDEFVIADCMSAKALLALLVEHSPSVVAKKLMLYFILIMWFKV